MSATIRISTALNPKHPYDSSKNLSKISQFYSILSFKAVFSVRKSSALCHKAHIITRLILKPTAFIEDGSLQHLDDSPLLVELEPVCSDTQFDRVIAEAQQLQEPVIIVWMARWCRKCIYLKPKLEKLAAEYHPRVRFYCVDVNAVPHKLVARAGVTKMPTIQLWKDGKQQAEVIGGHKAYMVVNEVREMIENDCST